MRMLISRVRTVTTYAIAPLSRTIALAGPTASKTRTIEWH